MAAWVAPAIAAGAAVGQGIGGSVMGWKQMKAQNKFSERMSNTAHQRAVIDLKKAGLNPILSATGGSSASSPQGSTPSLGDPSGGAIDKYIAMRLAKNSVRQSDAEINFTNQKREQSVQDEMTSGALDLKYTTESALTNERFQTEKVARRLLTYQLNEAQSTSKMWKDLGQAGKTGQLLMPILKSLMGRK